VSVNHGNIAVTRLRRNAAPRQSRGGATVEIPTGPKPRFYPSETSLAWQRALSFVGALGLLIFFAPGMIVTAVAIYCQDGGPVLFRHKRVGYDGVEFDCLKFRSMRIDAAERLAALLAENPSARLEWARDHKLRNDPRTTRLGLILRKTSIDELPQLFNVLLGEMSLVGPRPIVRDEISRYRHYIRYYYAVRPGLTGLWQISGRNDTTYRQRVALDTIYVRTQSVWMDIKILLGTVVAVLTNRGSY
jgi:exopolysaccharide production protein ExoY